MPVQQYSEQFNQAGHNWRGEAGADAVGAKRARPDDDDGEGGEGAKNPRFRSEEEN